MSRFGAIGVEIFLVITGYFLVDFAKVEKNFSVREYMKARFLKLWPIYAISITVTAVTVHFFYLPGRTSTRLDWLLNLFFINGFIGTAYVDGAHWYMTTLISITVVMAIAKKLRQDKNPLFYLVWIGCRVACSLFDIPCSPNLLGGNYVGCISISVAAKFISQKQKEITQKDAFLWGGVVLTAVGYTVIYNGIISLIEIIIITLIFLCCIKEKMPCFENRCLLFLGKISYPLYLIHQNISFVIEFYLMKAFGYYSLWYGIPAIIVSAFMAIMLYQFNQKMQQKLKTFG